jgi:hypothetical protein
MCDLGSFRPVNRSLYADSLELQVNGKTSAISLR